ncbi:MAG: hypothetical protein BMS9Abin29_2208 [Gemmatimonadota bacterium]|nr:MAG: hypothetical protein BMS9Abin29_2208 [Gemmatimonadota bacterium]
MNPTSWLDERLGLREVKRVLLDRKVPARLTWWHTLGSATLTVFLLLVVTGIVLATYYSASPDHAYDSVRFTEEQVLGGSLLRGIHHWSASAMVILILAHMIRVFSAGAYKYPREVNWLVGVGLFLVVMAFSFTGYLLPWDQKAYWATQVGVGMAGTTPLVGGILSSLLSGGDQLGAATLSRFFAFHVLWLPLSLGVLVLLHLTMVIRQGIAARPSDMERGAPATTADPAYGEFYAKTYEASKEEGRRFWPDVVAKDIIMSLGVVLVIVVLAWAFGSPLEAPADPSDTSYVPRPEWYFLPLYQLLKMVPGWAESLVAVGTPAAIILALLTLPFFDRRSSRSLTNRPFAIVSLTLILAGSGFLIGLSGREDVAAIAEEIGRPLSSMERAGIATYKQQGCSDCHMIGEVGGDEGPDLSDIGLRHSIAWLHSFLEEPGRFRGTTDMPAYGPPNLSHQEVEELARYLASLRGGAGPEVQPQYADTFPAPRGR